MPYKYYQHGYVRIWLPEEKRLLAEHRYVMEKKLGRKLVSGEVVHHKDGNRENNKINNLELMLDGEHRRMHLIGKPRECVRRYQQFRSLPRTNYKVGTIISLLPEYRTMELIECAVCNKKHWRRKHKTTRNCSQKCAQTLAWREGRYEKRRSKNSNRGNN